MVMEWDEHAGNPFEDDEDDQDDEVHRESSRELIVYLVDCCQDMFLELEESSDRATYFSTAVKAIVADLKNRVIGNERDQVGVCFFNTREKKNIQEWDGVYILHEVGSLSAQLIRSVSSLPESFDEKLGSRSTTRHGVSATSNPLQHGLWTCQLLLQSGMAKNVTKRVLLFTNNDDPFGELSPVLASDMKRTTIQRAIDMKGVDISIELFPMSRPGEEFSVALFYADMLKVEDNDETSRYMVVAARRFDELLYQIKKKRFTKRVLRQLRFSICQRVEIGVSMYAMFRQATPPKHTLVRARDNVPVVADTTAICNDTGAILPTGGGAGKKFCKYGDEKVIFTSTEIKEVKSLMPEKSVMKLLGFKPLDCLKDYHNLRPSVFLYPDERSVRGSTTVFIALHKSMLRLGRFAEAVVPRHLGEPQLVALVPQEEVADETGQLTPPGLQMIYLPFCDDLRQIEKVNVDNEKPAPRASRNQMDKAMTLIQKLNITNFSMDTVHNPALQRHYAVLEACALQEDAVLDFKDDTLPNEKGFNKTSTTAAIAALKDEVYGPNHDAEEAELASKGGAASQKRKAVADAAVSEAANYDWKNLAATGKLKSLTVVELKYYLAAHGLSQTGKKDVLIQRILDHLKF